MITIAHPEHSSGELKIQYRCRESEKNRVTWKACRNVESGELFLMWENDLLQELLVNTAKSPITS